jgi:hypothetical protein
MQSVLSAALPTPAAPLGEAVEVQETLLSRQARRNAQAQARARTLLEELALLLRRVLPCLADALRYQDAVVARLAGSGTQFTSFTGTRVQTLTDLRAQALSLLALLVQKCKR